ncbi:MAG: non-canonical purine NTP pyrophosphatase [bacterium]|nr:non-canonical purine NTP pyrophosphatase [bacterium]
MKKIYFVTTNTYKFQKFSQALDIPSIILEQLSEKVPEIQAANNQEIAAFSAQWAAKKFKVPVVKEDVGLYIRALRGFPGPYLNQVEGWIEAGGFVKLMADKKDRFAYWEYAISYCEPKRSPITFYAHQKGSIAITAKGKSGWDTNTIFIPEGQDKTIAELLVEKKYIRNEEHYRQLKEFFLKTSK